MLNGPLNWPPCLIGPNSSMYVQAEFSGPQCTEYKAKFVSKPKTKKKTQKNTNNKNYLLQEMLFCGLFQLYFEVLSLSTFAHSAKKKKKKKKKNM